MTYMKKYLKTEFNPELFNSYVKYKYNNQTLTKIDIQNINKILILLFNKYIYVNKIDEKDKSIILNNCSAWLFWVSQADGRVERKKSRLVKNLVKLFLPYKKLL